MVCVKLKDEFHEGIPYKNSQFTDSKRARTTAVAPVKHKRLIWNMEQFNLGVL